MKIPETQQKILNSAKRWFLEKGFKSAPLRKIVNDVGFTLGAFYGYYKNKEELFYALTDETAQGLATIVRSIGEDSASPSGVGSLSLRSPGRNGVTTSLC